MMTLQSILREATQRLKSSTDTPQLDAEILLMNLLNQSRAFLYAHSDDILEPHLVTQFLSIISERIKGLPIAYLVGEREFWSLPLYVTPDTLIPRPETELLVTCALDLLATREICSVLELGTGTGAISIALATEKPTWHFLASDNSPNTLRVTDKNIHRHHLKNITLIQSDWYKNINNSQFDLIISNPPYLANNDPHQYQGDLRFEPKEALLSGANGFDDLNIIIQNAVNYLAPGGLLLLEHGYTQAQAVRQALDFEAYQNIKTWQDDNQLDRVTAGWKSI